MSMPKRNDPKYIDIENFKDYELTNCIAYEMVIRNDEFIKTKKELFALAKKLDHLLLLRNKNSQKEFNEIFPRLLKNMGQQWFKSEEELNDLYLFMFKTYSSSKDIKYKTSYCKDIEELQISYTNKLNEAKEKFGLVINKGTLSLDKKISVRKQGELESWVHGIEKHTGKHVGLYEDGRHKVHGIKTKDDIRDSISFTELIYSRPKLEFPNMKSTHIKVNLALPPNELELYIQEIKRQFDKDQSIIKTASEIFGREYILNEDTKDILVSGHARADMFYVYDSLKLGFTQRAIQNEVYNYYQDIGNQTRTLSDRALRKYKKIANSMIDNRGFKELLTGFKN